MTSAQRTALLSVIIPVYNEAHTVRTLLDRVASVRMDGVALQIIIVNDGSTDGSAEIIRAWAASHPECSTLCMEQTNLGKGAAVRAGIQHSTGDVVIIQDADLEYDPDDYAACAGPILRGECKVVYGSREDANRNRIYSSPGFYLGGLSLTFWINLLYNANLTDEATCYKTFDGPLIRALPFEGNHFEWEPEITSKLLRLGYEIREVPIGYFPRKTSEGKKIRFRDGLQAFAAAFRWRFASLKKERAAVKSIDSESCAHIRQSGFAQGALLAVVLIAVLLRLTYAVPGMLQPELLMRLDTASYMGPAQSMLSDGTFAAAPGGVPCAVRPPLYPVFLTFCLGVSGGGLAFCAAMSAILGGLIAGIVYMTCRLYGNWKVSFAAALLFALNPTAIALSPMFLSDTLFLFFAALQTMFFLKFIKCRFAMFFFASIAAAGLATLTRPTNLLWLGPALFVLWCMPKFPLRLKFSYSLIALLLSALLVGPWLLRSKSIGIGFRMDACQSNMLMQNYSAYESRKTGTPAPELWERYRTLFREEFETHPERYPDDGAKMDYQDRFMMKKIFAEPTGYFALYFRPYVLFPDVASFLENLGLTVTGRNTADVLNRKGVFAAVLHYFDGNLPLLCGMIPLVALTGLLYLFGFGEVVRRCLRLDYMSFLLFLLLAEYYFFLPGSVPMPRYQLPALPFLCAMTASMLDFLRRHSKFFGKLFRVPPSDV